MSPTTLTISRLSMSPQQCLRNDLFKVWFTKNGVRYVVDTLPDHEAWLANPHQLAIHRLAPRQRHQHFSLCHRCNIHQHPRYARWTY
jgi:hypothetical protein